MTRTAVPVDAATPPASDLLGAEIAAFEAMKQELLAEYDHQWVVFFGCKFRRAFSDFHDACVWAEDEFGYEAPFMICQVGAPPIHLPISLAVARR